MIKRTAAKFGSSAHSAHKKKWTTPLLTVLVRGQPEERLLAACKDAWNMVGSGPTSSFCSCATSSGPCVLCSSDSPS